jgi:hypothetical protein
VPAAITSPRMPATAWYPVGTVNGPRPGVPSSPYCRIRRPVTSQTLWLPVSGTTADASPSRTRPPASGTAYATSRPLGNRTCTTLVR